jgi:hypothetical protein
LRYAQESLFVDISANTQPKIKENPIAAVRYVIGGKLNKINLMILMSIRMAQIAYDMRDIISVAFLDIGYALDVVSYNFSECSKKIVSKQLYKYVG